MRSARGFSLIDMFLTLAVLAVLAAVVLPRYEDKSDQARRAAVLAQLEIIRKQIEVYNAANPGDPFAPLKAAGQRPDTRASARRDGPKGVGARQANDAAKARQWQQLMEGGFLSAIPANPLQDDSTSIAAAPGDGVGWVFADPLHTGESIYAVDAGGRYFDADGDGVPD